MTVSILILGIFGFLLLSAAVTDVVSYTIPNWLNGAIFALFLIFILTELMEGRAMAWSVLRLHLLGGAAALAAGIMLFAVGWIGGGDAKLFAVACLWLGLGAMPNYAFLVCIIGGVLAIAILTFRRLTVYQKPDAWPWLRRLAESRDGIPYGVALSVAALLVLPHTELFRMVVN